MVFILAVPSCCPTDFKTLDSEARRFWTIAELYCFKKNNYNTLLFLYSF